MNSRIAAERLANQRITRQESDDPAAVVAWLGAVQAQDCRAAMWALGLRMPDGATAAGVQRSLDEGRILRTHVLRPTWHFVVPSDIHWMLELTAPHVQRSLAYGCRHLGLDEAMRVRATRVIERALGGGSHLTRPELGARLARAGIVVKGIALAFLTLHAELEGVICSGAQRGTQLTYALLGTRAPRPRRLSRDEALGELALRYFRSHAPATIRDFVWWSGLRMTDARRALEICGARAEAIEGLTYWRVGGGQRRNARSTSVHMLPVYDEYLVAYRDLEAVPRGKTTSGRLPQPLVIGGRFLGTWKPVTRAAEVAVEVTPTRPLTVSEQRALAKTAARYGRFLEKAVSVSGTARRDR